MGKKIQVHTEDYQNIPYLDYKTNYIILQHIKESKRKLKWILKKYFEWIEKENTPYQNLQNVSKVMCR